MLPNVDSNIFGWWIEMAEKVATDYYALEFLSVETIKHHSISFKSSANANYSQNISP